MDYSNREIVDVFVAEIRSGIDPNGDNLVSGEVTLTIENAVYEHRAGPHARLRVGLQPRGGESLEEIELQLLAAAHALVRKFADTPLEMLRDVYRRQRDDSNGPGPLADLRKS